jgi:PKD repeat protein
MFKQSTTLILLATALATTFSACHDDKDAPTPTVKFLASTTSTVTGTTVVFTNQSSEATTYVWEYGDGMASIATNASHKYDSIGTFKATLVAIGPGGTDSSSVAIAVKSANITILDGVGTKTTSIGNTWSSIKTKIGTNYQLEKDSDYNSSNKKVYIFGAYYEALGLEYLFYSYYSTLASADVVQEVTIMDPFVGTTQKGIAIGSPRGNVLYYYGQTPSSTATTTSGLYKYYFYDGYGIAFIIKIASNVVVAMDVYPIGKKKSAGPQPTQSIFFSKNKIY